MTETIIKAVNGKRPHWGDHCHFAENATIVGDISMGDDCSVWYGAVLRADVDRIIIGDRCNIQDLACIHQTAGRPAILGNDVSLGHGAVVHAATIHDGALIGMNAVVRCRGARENGDRTRRTMGRRTCPLREED